MGVAGKPHAGETSPDFRPGIPHPKVAGKGQGTARAGGRAIDLSDDGLITAADVPGCGGDIAHAGVRKGFPRIDPALECLDVPSGAEVLSGAG